MKFDLDTAWRDAMALLKAHLGLLATIAGVFYFLPYAAATSFVPEMAQLANPGSGMNPDAMMAVMEAMIAKYWWLFLALMILGGIGNLAMLALMRQRGKPTVGEALATGLRSIATYLGAQVIQAGAIVLAIFLLVAIPGAIGGQALAALGLILAIVVGIYIVIKLSLVSPVIAIDAELNPVAAIRRSWKLTKGNSLRLFLFFVLLALAFLVISTVASLLATLLFALASAEIASFGMGVMEAAINAVAVVVAACILAAIHTQLARLRARDEVPAEG